MSQKTRDERREKREEEKREEGKRSYLKFPTYTVVDTSSAYSYSMAVPLNCLSL